jgi:release factor glutamine methyltransferase
MLTVLESIKLSTEYLQKKGIESPRTNAELLLSKILKCKRLDLYLAFERPLTEEETNQYRQFIKRRGRFEPLQYIVGSVEFYGIEFLVNPSVLIPRPETEILVETILEEADKSNNLKILDIGCGSGNISISLAKNLPNSEVVSIDCSDDALKVAQQNAEFNGVGSQIKFLKNDITVDSEFKYDKFDIVVSNPPYIAKEEFNLLKPELQNYEPKIALTDGSDGFSFYKIISSKAKNFLSSKGKLYFEVGQGQAETVKNIMKKELYSNINFKKDYLNIDRVVKGEML